MNSFNVFKTFISRKLYKPRGGLVLFSFFLTIFFSLVVRNAELENTYLVKTNSFISVYSVDKIPILSEESDSLGFINPYFVFYLDSMSNMNGYGTGHVLAWIWSKSIDGNSGHVTSLKDENIRTWGNRDKLGRIGMNCHMDVIYQRKEYPWSLVRITTVFDPKTRLELASSKDLKNRMFRQLHLYTTDLSYYSVHKELRLKVIDIRTLFIEQPSITGILLYQIYVIILINLFIVLPQKKDRLINFLSISYSYAVGTVLCLLLNFVISIFF